MRIIISPAKKMNVDTDTAPARGLPCFLEQTRPLMEYLQGLDREQLKKIWKCNEKIAELNDRRLRVMDLERRLTPAILSYEGIQYQYMAPKVMEENALEWLQEHVRILSGFYGILKPFDGVTPYRLEMQARLGGETPGGRTIDGGTPGDETPGDATLDSLYTYWGSKLAERLFSETSLVLNLASKEYSKCISAYLSDFPEKRFVTCVFGELSGDRVVEKGTLAKMARGEMVRFLAEQQADSLETVKAFDRLGYRFWEERSSEDRLVFLKGN